jgi:predicted flap endonuclease-1-like 5' DNA nuclease
MDPAHFKPHETTTAIIEILIMLLVAVLIGFGVAWFLRQSSIDNLHGEVYSILQERKELIKQQQNEKEVAESMGLKLTRAQQTFKADVQSLTQEKERIISDLMLERKEANQYKEELTTLRPKIQLVDIELGRIALQTKQLENQLAETKKENIKLNAQLETAKELKQVRKEPVFSDFIAGQRLGGTVISEKDKDDLKHISGIGPVIEKKLNGLGIYTFRQISEFTPQMIQHVTSSIKFFPDRIGRDNWIGQAAALARHRK